MEQNNLDTYDPFRKNPAMEGIETLIDIHTDINSRFITNNVKKSDNTPKKQNDKFVVNLTELSDDENNVLNSFDQSSFFRSLENLKTTSANIFRLKENVDQIIDEGKERICSDCEGSGDTGKVNDPNIHKCTNCNGVGLL